MTRLIIHRFLAILIVACFTVFCHAQVPTAEPKPYKILTSGKQITVKSSKDIKSIMVWTASGHRILEQKEVNASSFRFNVNVTEKVFFVMIHYEGMKPFTEKIGIQ